MCIYIMKIIIIINTIIIMIMIIIIIIYTHVYEGLGNMG